MPTIHAPSELLHQVFRERSRHLERLREELRDGKRTIVLENLPGSALAFVLAELTKAENRPLLVLTAGVERAEDIAGDLEFFGIAQALHYPKWEVLPYDEDDLSIEATAKTLDVFEAIARRRSDAKSAPFAIAAPVDALMQRILPEKKVAGLTISFGWGDRIDPAQLMQQLLAAGYEQGPIVESRGEFSIRGGIVDIFPLNAENPIRLDLFGDEIESIRTFDVNTQRSLGDLGAEASIIIAPHHLKAQAGEHVKSGGKLETLFDHLPPDTLVVLESPERYNEVCSHFENAVERQYEAHGKVAGLPKPNELVVPAAEIPRYIDKFRRIEYSAHPPEADRKSVHIRFESENYAGAATDLDGWLSQLRKLQKADMLVVVACDNDGQVQRFDELMREAEIPARAVYPNGWTEGFELRNILTGFQEALLIVGGVQTGFCLPDARLCVITDREIFGRYKRRYVYKKIYKGKPIQTSADIRRGDFVVHVDHGIGRFLGMRVQEIDGRMMDLIEIEYDGGDKLLVPVEKITKVQKYCGPESAHPALDKLGSTKWAKRRAKHSEEIEKLAKELLELYAQRHVATRPPHAPDNHMVREFEASFLYQETPDQLKAITDSKADMERERPMDRLVCGDVGYGKTEVAIRAIFKCVQSGRQAAVLCPTTILAQQHFNSFRERYADFPVRVDMISRFKKPQEVKETKKKLKAGELDVVVGTHALLAKDVEFANLGLVVVDEEQRFGVKAKERLKEMRTALDLMTLSATPIPRTLHMALSGLRDLSLITTPPPDRQPIKTKIISFEAEQIAEAILRELNRGGQVYFVHNRVQSIEEVAKRLNEIVPHARITVAHGQMTPEELEDTMLKFIDREFDILVATTIIESGVDIPNCNTIIINRSDAFGLAQLYQLRGRVGRERKRAYAYLIVPQGKAITEAAVRRLQAIEEFAELGVGFSIAMRDLEIRGAGDILGKNQHGAITDIGFELFCELLEERTRELKGESGPSFYDVEVRWDSSSFIPPNYVPMEAQRVMFYKRFAEARTNELIADVEKELRDRFGELPLPVRIFVESCRLRIASQPLRVAAFRKSQNKVRITTILPVKPETESALQAAMKAVPEVQGVRIDGLDQLVVTLKEGIEPFPALELMIAFVREAAA